MRVRALALDELWIGEMVPLVLDGTPVALLRLESGVFAYHDRCAHQGFRFSSGTLVNGCITCPVHGWQYDAATGCGRNPVGVSLRALPVAIVDGAIWVELDDARAAQRG